MVTHPVCRAEHVANIFDVKSRDNWAIVPCEIAQSIVIAIGTGKVGHPDAVVPGRYDVGVYFLRNFSLHSLKEDHPNGPHEGSSNAPQPRLVFGRIRKLFLVQIEVATIAEHCNPK
jgi:hypothetical protein